MTTPRRAAPARAQDVNMHAHNGVRSDFPSAKVAKDLIAPFRQSERAFQGAVVRYARLMGWAVYHTFDSRRSAAGFPDLVMVRRPRVVFAELKAERGRLTEAQREWLDALRESGQTAYCWRPSSWAHIEKVLR